MTASQILDEQWKLVDAILDAVGLSEIPKMRMQAFSMSLAVDEIPVISVRFVPDEMQIPVTKAFRLEAKPLDGEAAAASDEQNATNPGD